MSKKDELNSFLEAHNINAKDILIMSFLHDFPRTSLGELSALLSHSEMRLRRQLKRLSEHKDTQYLLMPKRLTRKGEVSLNDKGERIVQEFRHHLEL